MGGPAAVRGWPGETVARQRGDDEVDGVGRVAAMRGRVGERSQHPLELHDRPRPAVQQHQRDGGRLR